MSGQAMREFDIGGPSRRRSLDGVSILLVEDSLSASEAMRLMALSCGARLRRADSIDTALQHLRTYRPNIVIVDLGLPDGNGLELIRQIADNDELQTGIVAVSGADDSEWATSARDAGASGILPKPIDGIGAFQDTLLGCLADAAERQDFRRATRVPKTDGQALSRDIETISAQLASAIAEEDMRAMRYCGRFVEGIARELDQPDLRKAARDLYDPDLAPAERTRIAARVMDGVRGLSLPEDR